METKICNKCNTEKPVIEFRNRADSKDGKRNDCKICQSKHNKSYNQANAIIISKKRTKFYYDNQERLLTEKKANYNTNKKVFIERNRQYLNKKRNTDPIFKLKRNMRTMINKALKKKGFTKKSQTFQIIGCLQDEFIHYIESKWESWMNWGNYGLYNGEPNYGWDIDHIKPLITGITETEIINLNHYNNLQPLCSLYNRKIKRDSY